MRFNLKYLSLLNIWHIIDRFTSFPKKYVLTFMLCAKCNQLTYNFKYYNQ